MKKFRYNSGVVVVINDKIASKYAQKNPSIGKIIGEADKEDTADGDKKKPADGDKKKPADGDKK